MNKVKTLKNTVWGTAFMIGAVLFASCTNATIYHAYQSIDEEGWSKHDTLVYRLPPDSVRDIYSINIGLRTSDTYRYTGLWLVIAQDLEKKGSFVRDTINYQITDKNGIMLGKGYATHQQEKPFLTIRTTPYGGRTIKIFHIMKREVISGIKDVGINVLSDSLQRQSLKR